MTVFTRCPGNPILSREDIPDVPPALVDATSVFNPAACAFDGRDLLLLRVQTRGRETHLMVAESAADVGAADGAADGSSGFRVRPALVRLEGFEAVGSHIHHIYDPRITRTADGWYVVLAVDVDETCRLAVARAEDGFDRLVFVGTAGDGDVRNGAIFPERIGGCYAMLARPNRVRIGEGPTTGDEIVLLVSDDLTSWREAGPVMSGRRHLWDEIIGPGPPPVKTRDGWLLVYHGVATHLVGSWIYQAGVALLDLDDPTHVIARGRDNVLEPRETYETVGQVPNVVFPSGLVVEAVGADGSARADSDCRLYYGAADTSVCLATSTVGRLLEACRV